MERPERDDRLRAVRETIDVLVGQGERGLKGVLRASLLLKMEKGGAEMVEEEQAVVAMVAVETVVEDTEAVDTKHLTQPTK